jgi:dipeptidyl aminopeptidase/acylaminoacyl peptidase
MRRLLLLLLVGCAPQKAASPYPAAEPDTGEVPRRPEETGEKAGETEARYFDRALDLGPFLAGFPYQDFRPSLRTGRLFFLETGDDYVLEMLDLRWLRGAAASDAPFSALDLGAAKAISDADWSKRSLWSVHHEKARDILWLHADAKNDERMNLWTLDLADGKISQVTDHDYVYGYGFDESDERLAYLPRQGTQAPYRACLHVMEVSTHEDRRVVCDSPELSFTWSRPRFSPDGREVYLSAQIDGDRNRVQLVRVDLRAATPTAAVVTNPRVRRNTASPLRGWLDDDTLLFLADDDGYDNLYAYARTRGRVEQRTRFREDMTSAKLMDAGVVGVHRTPAGSTLVLVDPRTGASKTLRRFPGTVDVVDAHGSLVVYTQVAPDIVFEAHLARIGPASMQTGPLVLVDDRLEEQIVSCRASTVKIPTFDVDPATGRTRELHAFLLEPRRPLEDPGQHLALVRAFYGGANTYDTFDQIMCAAGFTIVSPSVRGSRGFGRAFSSLNDKDLGGDEIVDLFFAARWAEKHTGLPASRIGVYGRSHGGYATMRALTFPPQTNGRSESYTFGFGMSDAGFFDIKTFFDATNIPDWVVLESGDPAVPADLARMKDRSPLTHADLLRVPVLLTHGSNDWRVPVQESRQFVRRAKELGKDVTYMEFEGQGHHVEGLARKVRAFQTRFDFLMDMAKRATDGATSSNGD